MSYGLQVFNEFGELIFGGKSLYKKETGLTTVEIKSQAWERYLPNVGWPGGNGLSINISTMGSFAFGSPAVRTVMFAHRTTPDTNINQLYRCSRHQWSVNDLVFVQIPTAGIVMASQSKQHRTDGKYTNLGTGIMAWYVAETSTPLEFIVASPDQVPNLTEGFGLQVFDAAGNVEFDSRAPVVSVKDHTFFTKDMAYSVLSTGVPIVITLRQPIPNAKMCLPLWMQGHNDETTGTLRTSGGTGNWSVGLLRIKQTSDTTIQVDRYVEPNFVFSATAFYYRFTHDVFIMFA
jgi:hypothetical protein